MNPPASLRPVTLRQLEVLRFVDTFVREHGRPPVHREIREGMPLQGVSQFLAYLRQLGLVTWQPTASGTLRVTEAGTLALARS